MPEPASPLLEAARAWYDAGFCVIPSHEDGGKRPFGRWKDYQEQRPDWAELYSWLSSGRYTGIGVITGAVSGNVEMLEIEGPQEQLAHRLDAVVAVAERFHAVGLKAILTQAVQGCAELSAGGGMHIFIRVTDGPAKPNTKLAHGGGKVLAETRGQGGFVIVAPTPARRGHADGAVYVLLSDASPAAVAEVTAEERDMLHLAFNLALDEGDTVIDQAPAPAPAAPKPVSTPGQPLSALDDYRARVTWRDILEPAGWTWSHNDGTRDHWVRPGKNKADGTSATTIEDGPLYNFSSNAPFPIEVGLSKGQVYAHLHHDGDTSAAARALTDNGYGTATAPTQLPPWIPPNAATDPDNAPDDDSDLKRDYVLTHLPALDWHELWADDSEEEWLIEPLLPARRLVALYSAPKVGKSLLMLELAAAMAAGRAVFGYDAQPPRRVLYVDFENDPRADTRQRLQDMDYSPDDLGGLIMLSFPNMAALDSEKGSQELLAAVEVYGVEVVVVDTVSRSIQGDENENDTWLDFYRHTGMKLKRAQVALVRLDHAGKDEAKGQRGGSAKSGDVDAVWRMSRVGDELYELTCEANRFPLTERQLTIRREIGPLRHAPVGNAARARRDSLLHDLEAKGVPKDRDMPLREVKKMVREMGVTFGNGALSTAVWETYCNRITPWSEGLEGAI